jgi:hypothetical protein
VVHRSAGTLRDARGQFSLMHWQVARIAMVCSEPVTAAASKTGKTRTLVRRRGAELGFCRSRSCRRLHPGPWFSCKLASLAVALYLASQTALLRLHTLGHVWNVTRTLSAVPQLPQNFPPGFAGVPHSEQNPIVDKQRLRTRG